MSWSSLLMHSNVIHTPEPSSLTSHSAPPRLTTPSGQSGCAPSTTDPVPTIAATPLPYSGGALRIEIASFAMRTSHAFPDAWTLCTIGSNSSRNEVAFGPENPAAPIQTHMSSYGWRRITSVIQLIAFFVERS